MTEQGRELAPVLRLRAHKADQDALGGCQPRESAWLRAVVLRDNQQAVVADGVPAGRGREGVELRG